MAFTTYKNTLLTYKMQFLTWLTTLPNVVNGVNNVVNHDNQRGKCIYVRGKPRCITG